MRTATLIAAGATLALAAAPPSAAAVVDVPPVPLIIRLYEALSTSPDCRAAALSEAADILGAAGLTTEWVPCASPAAAGRCNQPLARAELVVRVAPAPRQLPASGPLPLGYSLVNLQARGGSLATIYFDRVQWLAHAARADPGRLLGRAIAREIGHLLLGTPEHGENGVMRAVWSPHTVRQNRPAHWRFSPHEARQLRAAALAR